MDQHAVHRRHQRGEGARRNAERHAAGARGADHRPGRGRSRLRAPAPVAAPGRQARQHPAGRGRRDGRGRRRRRGAGVPLRLRRREGDRRGRRPRRVADQHRQRGGHPRLRVAGADQGPVPGPSLRHLRAGLRALQAAHRVGALSGRVRRRAGLRAPEQRAAEAQRPGAWPAAGPGRRRGDVDGQGTGRSLPDVPRDGRGRQGRPGGRRELRPAARPAHCRIRSLRRGRAHHAHSDHPGQRRRAQHIRGLVARRAGRTMAVRHRHDDAAPGRERLDRPAGDAALLHRAADHPAAVVHGAADHSPAVVDRPTHRAARRHRAAPRPAGRRTVGDARSAGRLGDETGIVAGLARRGCDGAAAVLVGAAAAGRAPRGSR